MVNYIGLNFDYPCMFMKDWETNKYLDCLWIDRLNLTPIQMGVGDADSYNTMPRV